MNFIQWDTAASDFTDGVVSPYRDRNKETALLTPTVSGSVTGLLEIPNEPNYRYLAKVHAEHIEAGKTSEQIARWTGEALNITAWKEGRFHGKRGALSTPDTPEERRRFEKFIQALGVTFDTSKGMKYDNANGPSIYQPQYFLLDGFVQNAWLGRENMLKRDKKLSKMYHALMHIKDAKARAQYIYEKIGLDVCDDWSQCNTGYRAPLLGKGYHEGISIGGSLIHEEGEITKRAHVLGIGRENSDFYDNTAATGRLCILR